MARVAATPARQPAKSNSGARYTARINTPPRAPAKPNRVAATPAKAPARRSAPSSGGRAVTTGGSGGGYSGGGGGGGYSGGGGGGYSGGGESFDGGGLESFAVENPGIEVPDPMADATYQRQTSELARAMADFKAQQNLAKAQYETQYGMGLRRLGWDQFAGRATGFGNAKTPEGGGWSRELPGAYAQSYDANEGDFAGRGMYNSGLYTRAVSDLNEDFTDRKNTMDVARTDWNATQALNLKNTESSQETIRQSALTDAVARIAAQYGVNLSDVTPGKANRVVR